MPFLNFWIFFQSNRKENPYTRSDTSYNSVKNAQKIESGKFCRNSDSVTAGLSRNFKYFPRILIPWKIDSFGVTEHTIPIGVPEILRSDSVPWRDWNISDKNGNKQPFAKIQLYFQVWLICIIRNGRILFCNGRRIERMLKGLSVLYADWYAKLVRKGGIICAAGAKLHHWSYRE